MSSLRRWRQFGQGQFQKWEASGQELEGLWQGIHEGRFGPLGTLDTADGRFTFPLPVALRERLGQVRPGLLVLVRAIPASRPQTPAGPSRASRSL
jgi:hypothetical protein